MQIHVEMHSEKCILQGTDIITAVIHIQKWMIITKQRLLCGLCWFKLSIHIAVMVIHYIKCTFTYNPLTEEPYISYISLYIPEVFLHGHKNPQDSFEQCRLTFGSVLYEPSIFSYPPQIYNCQSTLSVVPCFCLILFPLYLE